MLAEGKGLSFNTAKDIARKLAGEQKFAAIVAALPNATAALIQEAPHASEWIPLHHEIALTDMFVEVGFAGDLEAAFRLGDLSFTHDLNKFYKMFLKMLSPAFILGKIPAVFNTYYRNAGYARTIKHDGNYAVVELRDMFTCSPAYFETIRGVVHAGGVATRVRNMTTRFTEGAGTHSFALIEATWEL